MNGQIIFAGLRARPVRTGVGVLAVTLEVVLILLLIGAINGAITETGNRAAGVGGEILIKDKNSSYAVGFAQSVLPIPQMTPDLMAVPGVKAVTPVVTDTDALSTVVYGIDLESFNAVSGGFMFLDGGPFTKPDDAIIDDWQQMKMNARVGDRVKFLKRDFTISGIVSNGKGARIFIPLKTMQEKLKRPDLATLFFVKLNDGVSTEEAVERIKEKLADPAKEVIDVMALASLMFSSNAGLISGVFNFVEFLGVVIGILVIFLSMYTSVSERTREIGILRSMGASKGFVVLLVLQESLVLCTIGALVGIGASFILAALIKAVSPTTVILITNAWLVQAVLLALLSGVIGSIYPAYKAASQDPIEALAYE
jgi:putative ABC transport system permease protein